MDFHSRAPRVGGSDFGACENFAYRYAILFFVRGGGDENKIAYPLREKHFVRTPQIEGVDFSIFQKMVLRDFAYRVRLFRNIE